MKSSSKAPAACWWCRPPPAAVTWPNWPRPSIGLVNVFSELERDLDVMVIDTAAGITDSVLTFCQAAQDTVVVVCDEPASITDAYALIKVLSRERGVDRLQIIANMVRDPNEGRLLYDKLSRVCESSWATSR